MNDETLRALGKLVEGEPQRDAVHIAVIPVKNNAHGELRPGARVHVAYIGDDAQAWGGDPDEGYEDNEVDGVVDPFLTAPVPPGARFWLFLKPGSITSLRHHWTHPAFPAAAIPGSREESEKWLRDYAERYRADYDRMVAGAVSGDGYCFGDDDGPPSYRGAACEAEFWMHIEVVTGKRFAHAHREGTVFRCAC